eukprot:TRINITY_DN12260_c0_g1_i1.p3 TRINITY_DN12260_c0_g1~~TRINITY_DN12260_c0_g1_i1.p3  ORF type:complete len:104 (+),score=8.24 TRINITY_DN12260_c0_g1_i1:510-821(+)
MLERGRYCWRSDMRSCCGQWKSFTVLQKQQKVTLAVVMRGQAVWQPCHSTSRGCWNSREGWPGRQERQVLSRGHRDESFCAIRLRFLGMPNNMALRAACSSSA